jgi:hypothetical protein
LQTIRTFLDYKLVNAHHVSTGEIIFRHFRNVKFAHQY